MEHSLQFQNSKIKTGWYSLISLCLLTMIMLASCSEAPTKDTKQSFIVEMALNDAHNAVIDYLVFRNHRIDENGKNYIKAFLPSKIAVNFGDHGDFVHVWLETIDAKKTLVHVDVTSHGYVWYSKRDASVINGLERYLGAN